MNYISPPPLSFPLSEWHEPADYVRPEERGEVLEQGSVVSRDESEEKGGVIVSDERKYEGEEIKG